MIKSSRVGKRCLSADLDVNITRLQRQQRNFATHLDCVYLKFRRPKSDYACYEWVCENDTWSRSHK